MKISTQATKYINQHYGSAGDPAPEGVGALVQTIGAQLAGVEETIAFGKKFEEVVIVRVTSCEDHPNADRLHLCKIDDGGVVPDVERDGQGLVQIVCGANNVEVGMLAAWLPPGSTVPSTVGAEPFVLDVRDMRGQKSNGMLASARELGLGDDHSGILHIDEELGPITPGTMFADAFHLQGDVIINMENKMFTHRPDCFGWLGLARELEGIQHRPYKSPEWYTLNPTLPQPADGQLPLEVVNEIPQLVPRFVAIVVRDVQIKPSPVWLQVDLARAGVKSINNIVDYTNFYMLLTGQPIHAYDYDKVRAFCGGDKAVLTVRHPRSGEKIKLLNGKEITPRPEAMMVAAGHHLACLGGAMGGTDTEVSLGTKHIILEAATWDMYSMRKTSMEHGIFTEAVTRFNKGQSPLQNLATVAKIVSQICQHAGGTVASPLIDNNHVAPEVLERGNLHAPVAVTTQFINERLGWNLTAEDMATLLTNVEFEVEAKGDELTVTAPFWRTDIEIPEDVVEEIGRLNGYDQLPLDLPRRDLTPAARNSVLELKAQLRRRLATLGANETLTYSFVHGNLLDKVGQSREQAFQVANALSPDLQYYRLSLTPSLLDLVHPNSKADYSEFALFELGNAHNTVETDAEGLPREIDTLAFVFAANDKKAAEYAGAAYYHARKYLMHLLGDYPSVLYGLRYQPLAQADLFASPWLMYAATPYDLDRSAVLLDSNDQPWGVIGEYKSNVRAALKLPRFTAGFELDPHTLLGAHEVRYRTLSKFPSIEQDLCLKVSADTSYATVMQFLSDERDSFAKDWFFDISPVDIYQRPDDTAHKQITMRLMFVSYDRTLTDVEVTAVLDKLAAAAQQKLGAERV